jgi:hypothetical protein
MTIIIESTKGRRVYRGTGLTEAVDQTEVWLRKVIASDTCASITITVHQDGENCDHEHPEAI